MQSSRSMVFQNVLCDNLRVLDMLILSLACMFVFMQLCLLCNVTNIYFCSLIRITWERQLSIKQLVQAAWSVVVYLCHMVQDSSKFIHNNKHILSDNC